MRFWSERCRLIFLILWLLQNTSFCGDVGLLQVFYTAVSNEQNIMRLSEWNLYESPMSNDVTGVSNQITRSGLYDKGWRRREPPSSERWQLQSITEVSLFVATRKIDIFFNLTHCIWSLVPE